MKNTSPELLPFKAGLSIEDTTNRLRSHLTRVRLKWSIQRERIVTTFLTQDHITARNLYALLNGAGHRTPLAAIYRTMRLLCKLGVARPRYFWQENHYDNISAKQEHDHLICTQSEHIVEFDDPLIESLRRQVAEANDFHLISRHFELYGLCQTCRNTRSDENH